MNLSHHNRFRAPGWHTDDDVLRDLSRTKWDLVRCNQDCYSIISSNSKECCFTWKAGKWLATWLQILFSPKDQNQHVLLAAHCFWFNRDRKDNQIPQRSRDGFSSLTVLSQREEQEKRKMRKWKSSNCVLSWSFYEVYYRVRGYKIH